MRIAKKTVSISRQKREELRRQIIAGQDSATMRELRNLPKEKTIIMLSIRNMEIFKKVLLGPSQKILTKQGITNPKIQQKIFATALHGMRKGILLELGAAVKRASNTKDKQINEEALQKKLMENNELTGKRLRKLFANNTNAANEYVFELHRQHKQIAAFLESEKLPPQYRL